MKELREVIKAYKLQAEDKLGRKVGTGSGSRLEILVGKLMLRRYIGLE